jgi:hypothetical protein
MYKGVFFKKENLKDVKLAQTRRQNLSISTIDCQLAVVWGVCFEGNRKIVDPITTVRLQLKDSCILCNVFEFF